MLLWSSGVGLHSIEKHLTVLTAWLNIDWHRCHILKAYNTYVFLSCILRRLVYKLLLVIGLQGFLSCSLSLCQSLGFYGCPWL